MNPDYTIRPMEKVDCKRLAAIYQRAYNDPSTGEEWQEDQAAALLSYLFNLCPEMCFVAEGDSKLLGAFFSRVRPWWDGNHLVIEEIFVDPATQAKGIGSALSKEGYEKAIKDFQVVEVEALTFSNKEFPLSWYLSQGYSRKKEWTVITGNPHTLLDSLEKRR